MTEFAAEHWPEAHELFQQAHAVYPNARTSRGLGLTAYRLRRYADSRRHLEQALASQVVPLTPEQRAEAQQLLEWVQRYVGRVQLALRPRNARVTVDGVEMPSLSFVLDMGPHALSVHAPGHATQVQRVLVEGAGTHEITVGLVPLPPATPRPSPNTREIKADSSGSILASPWLWAAVGVVAAGSLGVVLATTGGDVKQEPPFASDKVLVAPMK